MKNRLAIASLNLTIGDFDKSTTLMTSAIEQARSRGAKLLVLPELATTSHHAKDLFLRHETIKNAAHVLEQLARYTRDIVVVCGTVICHENALYNVAAVMFNGQILAYVPKRYHGSSDEALRIFSRWDFTTSGVHEGVNVGAFCRRVGALECLELCVGDLALHPEPKPGALLAVVSNRQYVIGNYRDDLSMCIDYAEEFGVTIVRANLLGSDDGTHIFDGGGFVISSTKIEVLSPRFVFDQDLIMTYSDDAQTQDFEPTLSHLNAVGLSLTSDKDYLFVELELALCLALYDYMRKSGIQRLALALSGGRDSAMCAIIAWRMWVYRCKSHMATPKSSCDFSEILTCAYLPNAASSSNQTHRAATNLAHELGIPCHVIDIGVQVESTRRIVETSIGRSLTWETDDLTLQNIQARTRSTIIWTLANANNALLLVTSNLSEAAVGYTTMDGDSSGGLALIANIPKTLVSRWLEWARHFYKMDALEDVLSKPPSAELRPQTSRQEDEIDLMPYPVLDCFIESFIVEKRGRQETLDRARRQFKQHRDEAQLAGDFEKFVRLAAQSQWKRHRFANAFKVMDYDLDPCSELRWPILQKPALRDIDVP